MQWIILEGVRPYDGRYELDLATSRANTVEWGWIKRFSGYLPANADAGFEGNDPELMAALAVIALHRAGKIQPRDVQDVFDVIAAAPVGDTIIFDNDDPDDERVVDAGPPESRSNGNEPSSGQGSPTSSETSTSDPSSTGIPASATSGSDPPTSGT